jgi:hypothetical protein
MSSKSGKSVSYSDRVRGYLSSKEGGGAGEFFAASGLALVMAGALTTKFISYETERLAKCEAQTAAVARGEQVKDPLLCPVKRQPVAQVAPQC